MLSSLLNISHPIIQAPMALADSPLLATTVSQSGGLGSLGAALFSPAEIRAKIREIRSLTDKPFAINLFAPTPHQTYSKKEIHEALRRLNRFREKLHIPTLQEIDIQPSASFEEKLSVVLEEKVPVFSFTFGILPSSTIAKIKSHGITVIGTATTVREAKQLESHGVDAIVAQGYEAGGHRGTDLQMTAIEDALIGTIVLVPQVVDAVNIPVIASGGIMDARGIVAAIALGAAGVQLGTAFLACPESAIPDAHRQRLLNSSEESSRLTNVFTGRMARSLKNAFLLDMIENATPVLDYPIQSALVKDIRDIAKAKNNPDYMSLWAGQGSRLCQAISAKEVMAKLIHESENIDARIR